MAHLLLAMIISSPLNCTETGRKSGVLLGIDIWLAGLVTFAMWGHSRSSPPVPALGKYVRIVEYSTVCT